LNKLPQIYLSKILKKIPFLKLLFDKRRGKSYLK
jgi:hypothetical protein